MKQSNTTGNSGGAIEFWLEIGLESSGQASSTKDIQNISSQSACSCVNVVPFKVAYKKKVLGLNLIVPMYLPFPQVMAEDPNMSEAPNIYLFVGRRG